MEEQLIETERKLILELNKLDENRREEFRAKFDSLESKFKSLEIQIESLQKCVSLKEVADCKKSEEEVQVESLSDAEQQLQFLEENVMNSSLVQKAIDIVTKATELDKNKRYEEALQLYELSVDIFLNSIKYEVRGELAKKAVRTKCILYLDRANKIRNYFKLVMRDSKTT